MKERPILMNAFSVKAILAGRKTQTRRVIRPQPVLGQPWKNWVVDPEQMDLPRAYCPHGIPGDRLWVRENWATDWLHDGIKPRLLSKLDSDIYYRADGDIDTKTDPQVHRWRPSIFMPRWASRILIGITDVRVERVQDISEDDAQAEGVEFPGWDYRIKRNSWALNFSCLWDSINAKRGYGWDVNPWVWVIEWPQVN